MQEIYKFDIKTSVIPNVLEKDMTLIIYNNLILIARMQFMNSTLDSIITNLSDNHFK